MKTVLIIYVGLILLAVFLAQFRSDYWRIKQDISFIYRKGSRVQKIILCVILPLLLPFTIPFTIRNINNHKK